MKPNQLLIGVYQVNIVLQIITDYTHNLNVKIKISPQKTKNKPIINKQITNTKKYNQPQPITPQTIKASFLSIKQKNKFKTIFMILMTMSWETKRFKINYKLQVKSKHKNSLNLIKIHYVVGRIKSFMISTQKMTIKTSFFLANGVDCLNSTLLSLSFPFIFIMNLYQVILMT